MPDMEMRRMQEEAARRAREMQARARQPQRPRPAPQNQRDNRPPPPKEPTPPPQPLPPQTEPQTAEIAANQPPVPSLLEELFKDRERTVLLALLILLGNEEGSSELMFALLFLLM